VGIYLVGVILQGGELVLDPPIQAVIGRLLLHRHGFHDLKPRLLVGAQEDGALGVDLSDVPERLEEPFVDVTRAQRRLLSLRELEARQKGLHQLPLLLVLLPCSPACPTTRDAQPPSQLRGEEGRGGLTFRAETCPQ